MNSVLLTKLSSLIWRQCDCLSFVSNTIAQYVNKLDFMLWEFILAINLHFNKLK